MNILEILKNPEVEEKILLTVDEVDLPGDLETPVSAFLKLKKIGAKFLLESAEDPKSIGRYTFIGIKPLLKIELTMDQTIISTNQDKLEIPHTDENQPFDGLKKILASFKLTENNPEIPLLGGLVGYTSYEIVQFFEPKLKSLLHKPDQPIALYYFVDTLLVFDHYTRRMKLLRLKADGQALAADSEQVTLEQIKYALANERIPISAAKESLHNGYHSNFSKEQFEQAVEKAQSYIFKGDIFQGVISQVERHQSNVDGFQVYRALRMVNPSPYMYYLEFDELELIGSSPEALVKLLGRNATIRPIAGTRRRGRDIEDDKRMAQELIADEKERSEHVMLVDLGRNDLGRVSEYGSVSVTEMFHLEYYSHVMHMTSKVEGNLRDDCDQFDLFKAAFPAGTVSGAPKLRAMEIIAELEPNARGSYAGAVGYLSLSGDLDMCITIRTIIKQADILYLQAGAGIVADSIPDREYLETKNKIAALKEAVKRAEEGEL